MIVLGSIFLLLGRYLRVKSLISSKANYNDILRYQFSLDVSAFGYAFIFILTMCLLHYLVMFLI